MQATSLQESAHNGCDLKVEGHPALVKRGQAVVSTDDVEYTAALRRRLNAKKNEETIKNLESRVESIETKLELIFDFIKGLSKL